MVVRASRAARATRNRHGRARVLRSARFFLGRPRRFRRTEGHRSKRRLDMSLQKAKALFVELVANIPSGQWEARLAELSGADEELRRRVNQLLAAHRDAA